MTKKRRAVFAIVTLMATMTVTSVVLLAVDVQLHTKYQTSAGFNIWGYRGPAVGKKKRDEYRVVVLGGSSAYGYGVTWEQSIPARLERTLATAMPTGRRISVVNLAYNNEAAFSFTFTLNDYDYLQYDLAVLYEGYNDLSGESDRPNTSVFRHDSPVFRSTGYLPIFPIVFKEKAASMLAGGDPGALYRSSGRTVFHPTLTTRGAAGVLRTAGEVGQSLEEQLGRIHPDTAPRAVQVDDATGCKYPWRQYCTSVAKAIDLALSRRHQVMFVTQPYENAGQGLRERHMEQQREAAGMIARTYGREPRVRYVNLGDAADLNDAHLSFDHMHLTAAGNAIIAERLAPPVLDMATQAPPRD
jgi:hypothetical protein